MKTTPNETLFARLGGMDAVNAAVDIFYKKVLADDRISEFFEHTEMASQAKKQKAFLAFAFGAPTNYTGKSMREAHAHMALTEVHFNAVMEHLGDTLKELNVDPELIEEAASIAASTKKDVLGL